MVESEFVIENELLIRLLLVFIEEDSPVGEAVCATGIRLHFADGGSADSPTLPMAQDGNPYRKVCCLSYLNNK